MTASVDGVLFAARGGLDSLRVSLRPAADPLFRSGAFYEFSMIAGYDSWQLDYSPDRSSGTDTPPHVSQKFVRRGFQRLGRLPPSSPLDSLKRRAEADRVARAAGRSVGGAAPRAELRQQKFAGSIHIKDMPWFYRHSIQVEAGLATPETVSTPT